MTVSSAFDRCIAAMHLNNADEAQVRAYISKYAFPKDCCKIICWVISRIVNAVKSIFGCSDWQIAEKILQNHFLFLATNIYQETPQNETEKKIKEEIVISGLQDLASQLLDLSLSAKEGGVVEEREIERRDSLAVIQSMHETADALRELNRNMEGFRTTISPRIEQLRQTRPPFLN